MTLFSQKHFLKLKECASALDPHEASEWFLKKGYYPEGYVLPPCFSSIDFELHSSSLISNSDKPSDVKIITLPKTDLSVREYGVMHPKYFHDIVLLIEENFQNVVNHIFSPDTKIFSYSFPIPLDFNVPGKIESKRTDRMIYEFIEMAEKDLIADGYCYDYVVHSDIKNFYPSIYTHTISWVFHGRDWSRQNRWPRDSSFTNKLDHLIQHAHDGCTNGISIGSALSDFIAEVILAKVDVDISHQLSGIDFVGVRFKDDYRVLTKTKSDGEAVINAIQSQLRQVKLQIHEDKTDVKVLPEGLYREHIMRYAEHSFRQRTQNLKFKEFERIYFEVMKIDTEIPNRGVIDKFLGELVHEEGYIKVDFGFPSQEEKNIIKFISLLWKMYNRRPKVLPTLLGIFEILIERSTLARRVVISLLSDKVRDLGLNAEKKDYFFLCWTFYLFKTNNINTSVFSDDAGNSFWTSMFNDENRVFEDSVFNGYVPLSDCKERFGNINNNVLIFRNQTQLHASEEIDPEPF